MSTIVEYNYNSKETDLILDKNIGFKFDPRKGKNQRR